MTVDVSPPHLTGTQRASAVSFVVTCQGWSAGLGFSELAGFTSEVERQEYSYNGLTGNVLTKQFGRSRPPTIALRRALDARGFAQLMAWHALARMNNPLCKVPATFTIFDSGGAIVASCLLEQAWCAKLEIDSAKAGASDVVMMRTTIECDAILML